jgi:hypothetical protein
MSLIFKLFKAVEDNNINDTFNILRNNKFDEADYYRAFLKAVRRNYHKIMTYFFAIGIDLLIAKKYIIKKYENHEPGATVLLYAFTNSEHSTIELILSQPNSEPEYDNSLALFYAVVLNNLEICKLILLTGKCDFNYMRKNEHNSALSYAIKNKYNNIIELFTESEHISRFTILGQGSEGCIISPATNGDINYVSKIGGIDSTLEHEYNIYQKLPDGGPYFNKKDISLILLDKNNKDELSNICGNVNYYSSNLQLIMPKFKGIIFGKYLDQYYKSGPKEWYDLMIICITFKNQVYELNNTFKFTHGDLRLEDNIVYEDGKLMMIDFGYSFFNNESHQKNYSDDLKMIDQLFERVIRIGRHDRITSKLIPYLNINKIIEYVINNPSIFN